MYSINPAMIMTLVPLVGAAATHYSHFDMIHYGSYVSALSPLWMALFTTGDSLNQSMLLMVLVCGSCWHTPMIFETLESLELTCGSLCPPPPFRQCLGKFCCVPSHVH